MTTAWEKKHRAHIVLDAFQATYAAERARGLSHQEAGRAANVVAERARQRYSGLSACAEQDR